MKVIVGTTVGRTQAQPESSRVIRPAQLPPCPRVVGRDAAIAALDEAFAHHQRGAVRVIAVSGQAGVGKTALVVTWAHRVARRRHFENVFFADMRGYAADTTPTSPDEVVVDMLRGLGTAQSDLPASASRRAALLRTTLTGTRTLLVLDNVAHADQMSALVPADRGCLVLMTSRRRLSSSSSSHVVQHLALDPLAQDDGVALLRDLVGQHRVEAEVEAARQIVELCGGLPLGVRVAGECVATTRLPLTELAAQLAGAPDPLEVLAPPSSGDVLRPVFSWSLRHMDSETVRLFGLLGLHPGAEFGVGPAAALAGRDPRATGRMLDALTDVHLLEEVALRRYRFHDLVHSYAEDRARVERGPAENEAAVHRVLDWYARAVVTASRVATPYRKHTSTPVEAPLGLPDFAAPRAAVRWLEEGLPTFASVTRKAAAMGAGAVAFTISTALTDLLYWRNCWSLWDEPLQASLAEARRVGDVAAQGALLTNIGNGHLKQERFSEAEQCFEQALECRRQVEDRAGQVWALFGLGRTRQAADDHRTAEQHYRLARGLAEESEDRWAWAIATSYLGDVRRALGEHTAAAEHMDTAIEVLHELGARQSESCALNTRSDLCRDLGDEHGRLEHLHRAVAASEQAADFWGCADLHRKLGATYLDLGEREKAVAAWEDALRRFDALDDPRALMIRKELDALRGPQGVPSQGIG